MDDIDELRRELEAANMRAAAAEALQGQAEAHVADLETEVKRLTEELAKAKPDAPPRPATGRLGGIPIRSLPDGARYDSLRMAMQAELLRTLFEDDRSARMLGEQRPGRNYRQHYNPERMEYIDFLPPRRMDEAHTRMHHVTFSTDQVSRTINVLADLGEKRVTRRVGLHDNPVKVDGALKMMAAEIVGALGQTGLGRVDSIHKQLCEGMVRIKSKPGETWDIAI